MSSNSNSNSNPTSSSSHHHGLVLPTNVHKIFKDKGKKIVLRRLRRQFKEHLDKNYSKPARKKFHKKLKLKKPSEKKE